MFDKFDLSNIVANDGIIISVIGYVIVFLSLLFLSVIILKNSTLTLRQEEC